jgi:hypothetical protein
MNMQHIAPSWARWLIIPACIGFAALGIYLLHLFMIAATFKGPWWIAIVGSPFAIFPLYIAYRGIDLIKFRNIRAAVFNDELVIQDGRSSESVAHSISNLKIIDCSSMQVVHVVNAVVQQKLMTVDYYYNSGMSLIRLLEQKQAEQVAAPDGE